MKRKLFILFVSLVCSDLYAGSETGKIRFQHGQYGSNSSTAGKMFFYLDGDISKSGSPPCATHSNGDRWVISNDHPAAQIQLSILLAAYMGGKEVLAIGSGDCSVHGDSETAVDIMLK